MVGASDLQSRFKRARQAAGWTQPEVARHFSVDRSTVHRWEKGEFGLAIERVAECAALFGVRRAWLAFGEEPMIDARARRVPAPSKRRGRPPRARAS